MTELVAVQNDFALFNVRGRAVIVDTKRMNASDPEPLTAALSRGGWADPGVSLRPLPVWVELAEAAVSDVEQATTASANRAVRVPKRVKETAARGAAMTRNTKNVKLNVPARAAAKLSSDTVPMSTVKSIHGFFTRTAVPVKGVDSITAAAWMLHGGDAGREWAARTMAGALVAAGEIGLDSDLPDPESPHLFVPSPIDPTACDICGGIEDDEIHLPANAPEEAAAPSYFGIFDPEFNGPTFKITEILAKDTANAWWVREQGDWTPTEAPTNGAELTMLDEESLVAAISQLDKPGTTYAELSISEEKLFSLASSELDLDAYDAVFRLAPYVPPAVRSANAKKQVRDKNGRFFKPGAKINTPTGIGTVKSTNNDGTVEVEKDDGTVENIASTDVEVADGPDAANAPATDVPAVAAPVGVARLDTPLPLVPDVNVVLSDYLAQSRQKNSSSVQASALARSHQLNVQLMRKRIGLGPVTAAGDSNLIPPAEGPPVSAPDVTPAAPDDAPAPDAEIATPENSSNEPLYLAIVDKQDTQAVMDVVSVVPANATANTDLAVYRRVDGAWTYAPELLADLQGPTPPPVAQLDAPTLENVLSQMDPAEEADSTDTPVTEVPVAATDAVPVAAAAAPYGVMQRFSLTASGDMIVTEVPAPPQFRPYSETGIPQHIVSQMDELAAEGGADQNRGNAEKLRRYWEKGEGAAKIRWGTDGDWTRCVEHLSKHMGDRAKGYCTLRHKGALGYYPGELDRPGNPKSGEHSTSELPTFEEFQAQMRASQFDITGVIGGSGDDAPPALKPVDRGQDNDEDLAVDQNEPHVFKAADTVSEEGDLEEEGDAFFAEKGVNPFAKKDDKPVAASDPLHDSSERDDASTPADGPNCSICDKPESDSIHVVEADTVDAPPADSDAPADKINAAESLSASGEPSSATEVDEGTRFRMPLIIPEGVESGDGRQFAAESLSSRDVPLAVMWQPSTGDGHNGAVIVGRLDHVERLEGGGLGEGRGVFDTSPVAQEAVRLIRGGMLRGISADLDEFEAEILEQGETESKVTSTKLMVNSGRLMGVTLVPKPAFAECTIELDEGDVVVADGEYIEESAEARVAALLASAAPVHPPKNWFSDPGLSKPTHLTVDDDGRVYGHVAAWDVDHIGLPFGTRAPRSASNYAYFRTGMLRTAEGEDVPVGQLTLAGGHAPLAASAREAVKHYDDTASAWADVAAGEDKFGIWVSGALRPDVTPTQIRIARASSPSGDWRPIKGQLELVAACCVNVPGFPVARAMSLVAGGMVQALVAAGSMTLEQQAPHVQDDSSVLALRIEALEAAEKQRLMEKQLSIRARINPVLDHRHATLVASATAAKERVHARKAELTAQRETLVARVASLRADGGLLYKGNFEEKEHPRDHTGKFREVLGRLKDMMSGHDQVPASAEGLRALEDAADADDRGDNEEANRLAGTAADAFDSAASNLTDEAGDQLRNAAEDVRDVVARLDTALGAAEDAGDDPIGVDELPEAIRSMLEDVVSRIEQQINPVDPDQMYKNVIAFLQGTNFLRPSEVLNFMKRQTKQESVNKVTI